MRARIARAVRKWADLIDPRVRPSEVLTIRVECDASQFDAELARTLAKVRELQKLGKALL